MNKENEVIEVVTEKAETAAPDEAVASDKTETSASTEQAEDTADKAETEKAEQAEDASAKEEATATGTEEKDEISKEDIVKLVEKEFDLKRKEKETKELTEQPSGWDGVLSDGLPIMAAGMMGIFVVIGIIIVTISLLAKLGGGDGLFSKGVKALFSKNK
ncbi:MAG: hypothetical protein E7580_00780 [Ruminococcaceae bacterium]|nr:hypothetical protein [Oscillospiraceae bacterium]